MSQPSFSNSMIEAWWRVLKHHWLYLNSLDSISTLRRLVTFYVQEHNTRLPHSAFRGQTPDEMYYGRGDHVPRELEQARLAARRARLELNRTMYCSGLPKGRGIRGCLIRTRILDGLKDPASANSAPRTLGSADPHGTSYTCRQLEITDDRRGPR